MKTVKVSFGRLVAAQQKQMAPHSTGPGRAMGKPRTGRALTNEIKYPYIVELSVDLKELDAELSRQIIVFHTSRKIQVRHGRQITKENKIYFRWCFPDLTTAGAFIKRFGGTVYKR